MKSATIAVGDAKESDCLSLKGRDDSTVAASLDLPVALLVKLKRIANTDNAGVCELSSTERRELLVAERNRNRAPKAVRLATRAASKEYMRRWDADDHGLQPNATQILGADEKRKAMVELSASRAKAAGIEQSRWSALGPANVGGRVRAILFDSRDPNKLLVGSASGGIWRSTNAGQSFTAVADFSGNLTVGSMAVDPTNPNVVYAGTGESFAALVGVGMFKSTDGGLTWAHLASTTTDLRLNPLGASWTYINRIAVSEANPNVILSATDDAIFRSNNAGQSWTRVYARQALDLRFDPNNPNNLIAGLGAGSVVYSRDAGLSWQSPSTPLVRSGVGRVEVAYARNKTNVAFASVDSNEGEIWKTVDGGINWTLMSNPKHLEKQGDYDNTIWVDPFDDTHLVIGGIDLFRSTDGAQSFARISDWGNAGPGLPQPHADQHVIVAPPDYSAANRTLYIGNDGGVFRTSDITRAAPVGISTWVNLNNGLTTTQFYSGAGSLSAGGKIIGGTQDNGDLQRTAEVTWNEIGGGDGGYVAVDPVNDDTRYGEYTHASIRRFIGRELSDICTGLTDGNKDSCGPGAVQKANFIAPFILDPNSRDRLLVGANSLWLSEDARTSPSPNWRTIKPPVVVPDNNEHFINAIAVAKGDGNIIWVGHNASGNADVPTHIYKTTNGLAATPSWTLVSGPGMPNADVHRITIDPDNSNRVWVVYGGFSPSRAWVTEDGGANWRSISAGLPAVSLFDIKRHPIQRSWLYVAAANGVYTSEDAGQTWSAVNDGPNSVRVRELFWYDNETLVAATYGRGMFQVKVTAPATGPLDYSDMWWAGPTEDGWGMSIQQHANGVQFNAIYVYDADGQPRWYVMPGGTWNSSFTSYSGTIYQPQSAPFNNYDKSKFSVGAAAGTVTLNFTSSGTATLVYTINGISGTKAIQRQQFAGGTAPLKVGDLWWAGAAEDGWGINFAQQGGTIFGVWYTYGADGKNTWFVWPGGSWTGNTYSGTLYSTTGSPWLGVSYDRTKFKVTAVGSLSVTFTNANAASMSYNFNAGPYAGTNQTKPLIRQPY